MSLRAPRCSWFAVYNPWRVQIKNKSTYLFLLMNFYFEVIVAECHMTPKVSAYPCM
jgi:hypothetical protein